MLWKGEEGEEKLDDEVVVCGGWVVFSLIGDDRGDGVRLCWWPLSTVLLPDPGPENKLESSLLGYCHHYITKIV